MHTKAFIFVFYAIILMQACRPLLAQTPAPVQPNAPGLLQRLAKTAREVKDKVHDFGELALGFAGAYYEEHIQPVTASYVEWASDVKSSMLTKIKTSFDNYMPFKAKPTDQPPPN